MANGNIQALLRRTGWHWSLLKAIVGNKSPVQQPTWLNSIAANTIFGKQNRDFVVNFAT